MPRYTAPVTDTLFVLDNVIGIGRLGNVAGYAEATPDVVVPCWRKERSSARRCYSR